mgnify:FL=1|jgi:abortive infection bacteriophage resistance protein
MREGYYSIINGYKEPFLEPVVTKDDLSDRYKGNTSFDDIFALFTFDRSLRALTFRNLIKAEATARTAIAYTFASAHRGQDAYLLQESYCSEQEYLEYNRSNNSYADELSGLTSILKRTRDKSDSDFISHYRNAHGSVPIWVLCNALTFGNIQHFFNLMKPNEKASVCKMIAESTGRKGSKLLGYFDVDEARVSLEVLVKFRNLCAHDERLYCAHVGARKNVGYSKMIWMLERFLTEEEFYGFLRDVTDLVKNYLEVNAAGAHLLDDLGFPEMLSKMQQRINAH